MQQGIQHRVFKDEQICIPKSVTKEIINHKHYRAFMVFLQLKPLYVSGVILNDDSKLPYTQIAAYLGLSISGLRGKIKQLKKYKLLKVDNEKNFHLASYKTFVGLFKDQFLRRMKKYRYNNIASADMLIKASAIRENFRKQEYVLKNKILHKEIYGSVNAQVDRIKQPEGEIQSFQSNSSDCHGGQKRTDLSQTAIRKIRKILLKDYDLLLHNHKRKYFEQLEQIQDGYPQINPFVTLSCAGMGRLFGTCPSSGHYQRQMLSNAGILTIKSGGNHKIYPVSRHTSEDVRKEGGNIFSYNYPVKRNKGGREDKFFMRLADNISINLNFIYTNAKN